MSISLAQSKKYLIGIIGIPLLIFGIILLLLPGPGVVVVILALSLLASEYDWAKTPLDNIKNYLKNTRNSYKHYKNKMEKVSTQLKKDIKKSKTK